MSEVKVTKEMAEQPVIAPPPDMTALVGEIHIKCFHGVPPEVVFTGRMTGTDITRAWRGMMKEYRVWKHTLFNKDKKKVDGGDK